MGVLWSGQPGSTEPLLTCSAADAAVAHLPVALIAATPIFFDSGLVMASAANRSLYGLNNVLGGLAYPWALHPCAVTRVSPTQVTVSILGWSKITNVNKTRQERTTWKSRPVESWTPSSTVQSWHADEVSDQHLLPDTAYLYERISIITQGGKTPMCQHDSMSDITTVRPFNRQIHTYRLV